MKMKECVRTSMLLLSLIALVGINGCGQQSEPSGDGAKSVTDSAGNGQDQADTSHSGWWCVEHAVPEAECSICNSKVAADFKAKGDWCEEHNRAESQCFLCDPSRAEKFAKLYEAKFGEKPAKATE